MSLSTTCQASLDACFQGDWTAWSGLPGDCPTEEIPAYFDQFSPDVHQELLGLAHLLTDYHLFEHEACRGASRIWFREEKLLMLEVNYPTLGLTPPELLEKLGPAEGEMDYFDGDMDFEDCAKVYASKGLCVMVSMSGQTYRRLVFFTPCTFEAYKDQLAPYMHSGDRLANQYGA